MIDSAPEKVEAISPAETRGAYRRGAQTDSTSKDLRGAASGISRAVASISRPRQNSHDRSSIQPGSALSIRSARKLRPSVRSSRRTSSKPASVIACATIRAGDRGSEPTGSHQKYLLSSSARNSSGKPCLGDFSMSWICHALQNQASRTAKCGVSRPTAAVGNHHRLDTQTRQLRTPARWPSPSCDRTGAPFAPTFSEGARSSRNTDRVADATSR
jgi:hypothetical protein